MKLQRHKTPIHGVLANDQQAMLARRCKDIVGRKNVLTSKWRTRRYRTGYRFGSGAAAIVVSPGSLVELWNVLKLCIEADVVVIPQASNTGLTGGSTPFGEYERPVVILQMMRLSGIMLLGGGSQAICLPGTTLTQLEKALAPLGREPHSVIGSSCIGASVIGGVCNNSGGALVNRGPAFTSLALYARVTDHGCLELVNHLGVSLEDDPEEALRRLDMGAIDDTIVDWPEYSSASDGEYAEIVRDVEASTPARFNANSRTLFEASGSAGKVVIFAVRLDSFPKIAPQRLFYIGTNHPDEFTQLRREMLLSDLPLPTSAEYIHRAAFDCAARYGKDSFLAVRYLGPAAVRRAFGLKAALDGILAQTRFADMALTDRMLQYASAVLPLRLPRKLREWRDRFEHHLLLQVSGEAIPKIRSLLERRFPSTNGAFYLCDEMEAKTAMSLRFAVASAAIRYRAIHKDTVEDIIALDIALPRNERNWFENLPDAVNSKIKLKLYYGHFFCHVFHQDYLVKKGYKVDELEDELLKLLAERRGVFPAEHNVGHLYQAPPELERHYRSLDPTNRFNPGLGKTSKQRNWL